MKTGYIYSFDKVKDAVDFLGVSYATIGKWLSIPNQPVLPGLFLIQRGKLITEWRNVNDPYKEVLSYSNRKPVKVTNIESNAFWLFESIQECSEYLNITKDAVYLRLRRKYIVDNLIIEYYN